MNVGVWNLLVGEKTRKVHTMILWSLLISALYCSIVYKNGAKEHRSAHYFNNVVSGTELSHERGSLLTYVKLSACSAPKECRQKRGYRDSLTLLRYPAI